MADMTLKEIDSILWNALCQDCPEGSRKGYQLSREFPQILDAICKVRANATFASTKKNTVREKSSELDIDLKKFFEDNTEVDPPTD